MGRWDELAQKMPKSHLKDYMLGKAVAAREFHSWAVRTIKYNEKRVIRLKGRSTK